MTEENKVIEFTKSSLDDFGFTFDEEQSKNTASEIELLNLVNTSQGDKLKKYEAAFREVMQRITVFTNNLKSSPEKPTIMWPDRVAKIDKWMEELREIYNTTKE